MVLTGPRRAGKTLLLRRLFPKASYFLLEDPDVVAGSGPILVHQSPQAGTPTSAVAPGVRALPWQEFLEAL